MTPTALFLAFALTAVLPAQVEGWVVHKVALAPDGSGAVFGRFHNEEGRGELILRRGEIEKKLGRARVVRDIAFAPDGRWVITTDDSGMLRRVGLGGKELGALTLGRVGGFVRGVAVSPDGRRVAGVDDERRLQVFRVAGGERLWTRSLPELPLCVAFLPDGRLVTGDNLGSLALWSANGKQEHRVHVVPSGLMNLAGDVAGQQVAAGGWKGTIAVLDLESGKITKRAGEGRIYALAFDETGRRLAIARGAGGVSIWHIGGEETRMESEAVLGSLLFARSEVVATDYRGRVHRFPVAPVFDPARPESRTIAEEMAGLSWLAGTWSGAMWGGRFVAWYSSPAGGKILGYSKLFREDKEVFYEFEVFEPEGLAIAMRPFPGGKRAEGFTLVTHDLEARRAVFENPKKDYPTRIVYHRVSDDNLVITLSDPHGGSEKLDRFDLKLEVPATRRR